MGHDRRPCRHRHGFRVVGVGRTGTVVAEDLNAKGNADKPGCGRVRKAGLERFIQDTGLKSPRRMFECKAANVTVVKAGHLRSTTVLDLGRPNAEVDSGSYQRQGNPTSFGGRRNWETCVQFEIRKFVTVCEGVLVEGSRKTPAPWRSVAVAVVPAIYWAGQFVAQLKLEIRARGRAVVEMLTNQMFAPAGSGHATEVRANAAMGGLDGEIEHASSLIDTPQTGNLVGRAAGARPYLSFMNTLGSANASTAVPSTDMNADGWQLHGLTIQFPIPDAFRPDESGRRARRCDAGPAEMPHWRQDSEPGRSWP